MGENSTKEPPRDAAAHKELDRAGVFYLAAPFFGVSHGKIKIREPVCRRKLDREQVFRPAIVPEVHNTLRLESAANLEPEISTQCTNAPFYRVLWYYLHSAHGAEWKRDLAPKAPQDVKTSGLHNNVFSRDRDYVASTHPAPTLPSQWKCCDSQIPDLHTGSFVPPNGGYTTTLATAIMTTARLLIP